jgi:acyl carrier protein
MGSSDVLEKLQVIFRDCLENEDIVLTPSMTTDDVDGWNSLTHIQIVVAVEKMFRVRFTSKEIMNWKNVGEMSHSILSKA